MVLASTGTGDTIPNATVTVRQSGTTTNITETIYVNDDPDASQYTNGAFFTNATGLVTFYLTDQKRVDVLFTKTGYTSVTIPVDVQKSALVSATPLADAAPPAIAAAGSIGVSTEAAREDHTHSGSAYQALSDATKELGYTQVVADQLAIGTAVTDLTGLSVTVTCDGVRPIRIEGHVLCQKKTAGGQMDVFIFEGAASLQQASGSVSAADELTSIGPVWRGIPSAGAHTYKLRGKSVANTMDALAAADRPNFIEVVRLSLP